MLILTRKKGEVVRIGDDVSVTVLGIKGGQVQLGIDAPRDIAVHREEIYLRVEAESQAALDTCSHKEGASKAGVPIEIRKPVAIIQPSPKHGAPERRVLSMPKP